MANITRISGDYRNGGFERAVVGFDYESGKWVVEEGTVTESFDPRTFTVETTSYFMNDTEASMFCRRKGYK